MTGTRICNQCAKRRKAIEARKALLKNRGKKVQAATLGAVLAVTETVGNVFGITGEEGEHDEHDSGQHGETDPPFNEPVSTGSREDRGQLGA